MVRIGFWDPLYYDYYKEPLKCRVEGPYQAAARVDLQQIKTQASGSGFRVKAGLGFKGV